MTTKRRIDGVRVEVEDGTAEVTLDDVAVLEGARVTDTFGELEIELVSGDERAVQRVEKRLERLGAHRADGRTTIARALHVDTAEEPQSDAGRVSAYLTRCYHDLLRADAGVRLGADVEPVHQFRVATRRMRTLLRAGNAFLFGSSPEPTLDGAEGWFSWPVMDGQKICPKAEMVYCWQVAAVPAG